MFDNKLKKKIENEISKQINFEKSFKENNLDSLDLITAISVVEDEYKIEVKEKDLKKIDNFKSLFAFVKKHK